MATDDFLARRDECPESYCRTWRRRWCRMRMHKNFNIGHDLLTSMNWDFICAIIVTRHFTTYHNFIHPDLDLEI